MLLPLSQASQSKALVYVASKCSHVWTCLDFRPKMYLLYQSIGIDNGKAIFVIIDILPSLFVYVWRI